MGASPQITAKRVQNQQRPILIGKYQYGIGRQRKLLLPFWHHHDILFQIGRTFL
jgi:hypothetical protein